MKRVAVYMLIALALAIYIMIVISVGTAILPDHWAAQLVFYGVTGIIWIFPLMRIIEFFYKRRES
ncbi:DUF2842 domain-containing protein [Denitrobaculum tricleocarpae]|uniref:DUF2842 domain-containing protein n=1 Tax=Denitrobaculum tricleocarpae TaxID=2591009 RepID=UPI0015D458BC|nr:DUF2842 domain-containing protein [Denitrobaculum tricleocarpae]